MSPCVSHAGVCAHPSTADAHPAAAAGTVLILLCTANGEPFLDEQLASIAAQSYPHWRLVVSDDASADRPQAIVEVWRARLGAQRITLRSGPRRGFVANFLAVTCAPGCGVCACSWPAVSGTGIPATCGRYAPCDRI